MRKAIMNSEKVRERIRFINNMKILEKKMNIEEVSLINLRRRMKKLRKSTKKKKKYHLL